MKFKAFIISTLPALLLAGCSTHTSKNTTPVDEYKTVTVNFNEFEFESNTREISTGSTPGLFNDTMKAYINGEDGDYVDNVTSISYAGLKKIFSDGNPDFVPFNTLQIGSGSTDGTVRIKFTKEITSLTVVAQAYFKPIYDHWTIPDQPYTYYSIDADTTFKINGESWELPAAKLDEEKYTYLQVPERATKTFENIGNTLTITDDDFVGRIFVHSISFTYKVQ